MHGDDANRTGMSGANLSDLAPVILIGRGGGGTRIMSELVSSFGIFMGNEINVTFDSLEWLEPIYPMVIEKLTTPFEAGSERDLFWQDQVYARANDILRQYPGDASAFWGWKLPETTMVSAEMIRYFPRADFIHLIRHPIESCCRRTHITSRRNKPIGVACMEASYKHIGRPLEYLETDSEVMHNAAGWVMQTDMAVAAMNTLPDKSKALLVRYEDVVGNAQETAARVEAFLGSRVRTTGGALEIDPERVNAQARSHPEAARVWEICGRTASQFGYAYSQAQ